MREFQESRYILQKQESIIGIDANKIRQIKFRAREKTSVTLE